MLLGPDFGPFATGPWPAGQGVPGPRGPPGPGVPGPETLKITFSGLFAALGAFPTPRPGPDALSATPAPIARHLRARCGVFTAF